jgi:hypothetical protein
VVLAARDRAAVTEFIPLVWRGGPILAWPGLVPLYWGDFTEAQISSMETFLQAYVYYLQSRGAPAAQRCVISQYGVKGASFAIGYTQPAQPHEATEAEVKSLIESLQQQQHLPPFSPNRVFLVFTHGMSFSGYGSEWCGYHSTWGSGQYFAIIPYPTADGCGSSAPESSWQSITSHEINEAATDPAGGSGWVAGSEEGGDTCAWQEFKLSFGTIQLFEDNRQSTCSAWSPRTGQMWHTIRYTNGTWAPAYGLVEGQEHNNPGPFAAASCAGVGSDMQLVGLSADGQMWHTIRYANGSWAPNYGLVEGQEHNDPGPFTDVSCAGVGSDMQLVALSQDGQMWHTIRYANGSWAPNYGLVEGQEQNEPGPFLTVSCAGVGPDMQLVGLSQDGQMWHTIRYANGTWAPVFGLVEGQEQNNPGPFMAVSCAGVESDMQLIGLA